MHQYHKVCIAVVHMSVVLMGVYMDLTAVLMGVCMDVTAVLTVVHMDVTEC